MGNKKLPEHTESAVIKQLINVLADNQITYEQADDLFKKASQGLEIMSLSNQISHV